MPDWMIDLEKTAGRRRYHGWILYAADDGGVNPHYIDLYRKACGQYGMSIAFGTCRMSGKVLIGKRTILESLQSDRPDYVINRTRDYHLAEALEGWGIPVFNSSRVTELGNDKAKAYRYMQQRQAPVMNTVYNADEEPPWYPAVIKSCAGHGGTEVYFIRDREEYKRWRENTGLNVTDYGKNKEQHLAQPQYVMQQAASDLGKDVRVYIVGNRITASVLRTSRTDFRSNYCLGGHVELYDLSLAEQELVLQAVSGLSIGMAGIDFIFHQGQMVFNEIEDAAGARGLYTLTDYDIVNDFVSHIYTDISGRMAVP